MVFTVGVITLLFICGLGIALTIGQTANGNASTTGPLISIIALAPLVLYSLLILTFSSAQNHSLRIGLLSVRAAFTQLMGYGCGFISAWWKRCVRGKGEFEAYKKNFYK